jgi:hypothetical protein
MFSLPWELEFGMNKLVFGKKKLMLYSKKDKHFNFWRTPQYKRGF